MATPAVIRERNPGSRRNLRKTMRFPARGEMRPDSPALLQSNPLFSIKQGRSLDLLDGTTESPLEIPHKSRRTLI